MSLKIYEVTGDIFLASKEYSLAHCVGADLTMGRGIAMEFRNKFGQKDRLKSQNVRPGAVAILQDGQRFVYYLVTKAKSYLPGSYDTMLAALNAMRIHMLNNGIRKLAIPRLGCGLDKLDWAKVKAQIMEVFSQDSVEIVVYNYIRNKN